MTNEASTLLAAALKSATLSGSFSPAELGAKVGLNKFQAESAARDLSNAGVLELGFDCAANFSREYRMAHTQVVAKPASKSVAKPAAKARKK
jgi:hypothetical protein